MNWRASRAREILNAARGSDGHSQTTRLELLRRSALLADAEGDQKTATQARHSILHAHLWTNADVDMLAAFTWLLHENPTDYSVLWTYKWAALTLAGTASIRVPLVEQAIDDLEQRYTVAGLSTAAACQLRLEAAMIMKRQEQLPDLFDAWQRNEDGAGADCAACRRDTRVTYFLAMGEYERVVTESQPLLDGTLKCTEVPRGTFPYVLMPLLHTGRQAEADETYRRGAETLGDSERVPSGVGHYLIYLGLRGRIEEGCGILATWLRRALRSRDDLRRYNFLRGAALLFYSAKLRRLGVVHLTLSPAWEAYEPDGIYDVNELQSWFLKAAENLARRYDQRHGNSGYSDQLCRDREIMRDHLNNT